MRKPEYIKALKTAQDDLEKLFRDREELERKIARTRETVISLGLLVDHKPGYTSRYLPSSLTEACLNAIFAARVPLDPIGIRKDVERIGFDIGSSNPLASVYSVLNRLLQRKEIRKVYRLNPEPGPDNRRQPATQPIQQGAGFFLVPSQTEQTRKYRVVPGADGFRCACPDFELTGKPCKHAYAVEFMPRRETKPDGTVIETRAARVTYAQPWAAYNRRPPRRTSSARC